MSSKSHRKPSAFGGGGPEASKSSQSVAPSLNGPMSQENAHAMNGAFGNDFVQGIQRKGSGAVTSKDPAATFSDATRGGGQLPYRAEMEAAFGEDFSNVKASVGQSAAMGSIGAKAAASGETVAFADASPTKETVAHEVAHVAQARQFGGAGVNAKSAVSSPGQASEREADAVAAKVVAGESVQVSQAPGPGIALETDTEVTTDPEKALADAARAKAMGMDTAHDQAVEDDGLGLYYGNRLDYDESFGGAKPLDCTTYVLQVLESAFASVGRSADWTKAFNTAVANSNGAFKGIELMKALQTELSWEASYWNPDTKNPGDGSDEHTYSAYLAGKGGYYGLDVDPDKDVTNYAPSSGSDTTQDATDLETIKKLPFAVLAARGGMHMAMLIDGNVYEVHWSDQPTSKDVIEATPLESWGWMSGAISYPKGTWPTSG